LREAQHRIGGGFYFVFILSTSITKKQKPFPDYKEKGVNRPLSKLLTISLSH